MTKLHLPPDYSLFFLSKRTVKFVLEALSYGV